MKREFLLSIFTVILIAAVLTGCTTKTSNETAKETSNETVVKSYYKLSDWERYQEVQDDYFRYVVTPEGDVYLRELGTTKFRSFDTGHARENYQVTA